MYLKIHRANKASNQTSDFLAMVNLGPTVAGMCQSPKCLHSFLRLALKQYLYCRWILFVEFSDPYFEFF